MLPAISVMPRGGRLRQSGSGRQRRHCRSRSVREREIDCTDFTVGNWREGNRKLSGRERERELKKKESLEREIERSETVKKRRGEREFGVNWRAVNLKISERERLDNWRERERARDVWIWRD